MSTHITGQRTRRVRYLVQSDHCAYLAPQIRTRYASLRDSALIDLRHGAGQALRFGSKPPMRSLTPERRNEVFTPDACLVWTQSYQEIGEDRPIAFPLIASRGADELRSVCPLHKDVTRFKP